MIKLSKTVWNAQSNIIVPDVSPTKPSSNTDSASYVRYSTQVANYAKTEVYVPNVYLMPTTLIPQPANARHAISHSHIARPARTKHTVWVVIAIFTTPTTKVNVCSVTALPNLMVVLLVSMGIHASPVYLAPMYYSKANVLNAANLTLGVWIVLISKYAPIASKTISPKKVTACPAATIL